MYLRISSLALASIALASCGTQTPAPEGMDVQCAIGPGSEYAEVCTLEQVDPVEFIIHHPDGGFRRFVLADTGELTVADGAEPLTVEESPDDATMVELSLGNDRYRLKRKPIFSYSNE